MRPVPQSDGGYLFRLSGEVIPGFAAGLHDVVVSCEDGIGEPVVAQELPDVFDGVQLGASAPSRALSASWKSPVEMARR